MKNWKTTLAGVLTAAILIGYKIVTKEPLTAQDFILAAGAIGIGSNAKDNNVTGGTIKQ